MPIEIVFIIAKREIRTSFAIKKSFFYMYIEDIFINI